jgi:outer membrane autotransporter protein
MGATHLYADAAVTYTDGGSDNNIYRVDLITGVTTLVTPSPIAGAGLDGIALLNSNTAFTVGGLDNNAYRVDLRNGDVVKVTPSATPGATFSNIALANSSSAYTPGALSNRLYHINLMTGTVTPVTSPLPAVGLIDIALEMQIGSPTIGYTIDISNDTIYRIDLVTGGFSAVTEIPALIPSGIALLNNTTAYVTTNANNSVYRVNLQNGDYTLVTPVPIAGAGLKGIALANNTTAYVVGKASNEIYRVDLKTGAVTLVSGSPIAGASLNFLSLALQIGTATLTGNNLSFANYLNNKAPITLLRLFALQEDIASALESAIPTRNAISTFAAQTTQISLGKLVHNHLGHNRIVSQEISRANPLAKGHWQHNMTGLVADAKDNFGCPTVCKKETNFSPWLGGFGEYAKEKEQNQTPGFETGSWGLVAGFDSSGGTNKSQLLLGGAGAYAQTHVHEENGAGHAHIEQGALAFYGMFIPSKWYCDFGLWGGLYRTHNARFISFPDVSGKAVSDTHGWQLTPHFEIGYDSANEWFCFEPFAMIDWVFCWENGFEEFGASLLSMGQESRSCSLLRSELGFRFNEVLSYCWGSLVFREKGAYAYQKAFNTGSINAFVIGLPGSFSVTTFTGAQNLAVGEFEVVFLPNTKRYPYASFSYQGELGSKYQSHQGKITIGLNF